MTYRPSLSAMSPFYNLWPENSRLRVGKIMKVWMIAFLIVLKCTLVMDQAAALEQWPDTGQEKCYQVPDEISCPTEGNAFYGQDAQFVRVPRSYTKLGYGDVVLPNSATPEDGWVMTRDNVTGLIWEIKTDDGTIHDKDNSYTWCDTDTTTNGGLQGSCGSGTDTEDFIDAVNSEGFGDHNDWRIPTVQELSSLLNGSTSSPNPIIDKDWFPNTLSSLYHTSTTYYYPYSVSWFVDFSSGRVDNYQKSLSRQVRAVRGGSPQQLDPFVVNGDGTVTDNRTGLIWQRATAPGSYTWQQALAYADTLELAGHSDWRLPDRNELQSIVDYSRFSPTIDTSVFLDTSSSYWTSTNDVTNAYSAWNVSFGTGTVAPGYKGNNAYKVRVVRFVPLPRDVIVLEVNPLAGLINTQTSVTITGSNFGDHQGTGLVTFGDLTATITSWKDTEIVCVAPAQPAATVNVIVSTNAGEVRVKTAGFTYSPDVDNDGSIATIDFDDTDSSVYPGAPELCDRKDNNQNGLYDENISCFYPEYPVPDTGKSRCYDSELIISCPQEGEAYFGQDHSYEINVPSFLKLAQGGVALPFSATPGDGWIMTRDNVTGLTWEIKQNKDSVKNYANPNDAENTYTWCDKNSNGEPIGYCGEGTDTEDFIAELNHNNFGGFSDWRLPSRYEMQTILNYGKLLPATDTTFFPNTMSDNYWSSTKCSESSTNCARAIYAYSGGDGLYLGGDLHVRAVRGAKIPTSSVRYYDNKNGTITDQATGLMWQQATASGTFTWQEALAYAENLIIAGYDDWRLPNIKELVSITSNKTSPTIDMDVFHDTRLADYWSSTTRESFDNAEGSFPAWYIEFDSGRIVNITGKKTNKKNIRVVRGVPGEYEIDSDDDGIIDRIDNCLDIYNTDQSDVDGDDIGDACDDGDYDQDGLTDAKEYALGTDPTNPDTDGDGVLDGNEVNCGSNPLDPESTM